MATTYQIFADFPDHRVTGRCIYSISDLLTISLLTYLCGGEDYVDMSEFAHVRARDFNLLTDNYTSPSPDTFERLMPAVCRRSCAAACPNTGDPSCHRSLRSRWR